MTHTLTLGIAGLGTVGSGLLQLLAAHGDRYERMLSCRIKVGAVSSRNRDKDRGVSLDGMVWFDDPVEMAKSADIDVFVELIGGDEGPARDSVEAALAAGRHVVTANKALLAKHGIALARVAEENSVALNFEAAVAGGIPVIKTLREALLPNEITRVYGILNGTCNYILTTMQEDGRSFSDVLAEAQAKGYAEADPTFDIGGFDTAHKLSLLTSLAFGTEVAFEDIDVEGIEAITQTDIEAADRLGYRIKLLGVAMATESGIEARVHPAMVPKHSAIAEVSGVTNCVAVDGDYTGNLLLVGPGAGAKPTAAAVAADILDIARGMRMPPFIQPTSQLSPATSAPLGAHCGAYYVRLSVLDEPGAMGAIAKCMGDQNVSLESVVQRQDDNALPGGGLSANGVPVVVTIITHETNENAMRDALKAIGKIGKVSEAPQIIRIEKL